jgi:hypothetical protein
MDKQSKMGIVLAVFMAMGISSGTAMAQTKDAPKCVSTDGKEIKAPDGTAITTKADCEKEGGTLQAPKK